MMYDTAEEQVKEEQAQQEPSFRLATVAELFADGCAKVQFYGEESASEKEYSYLASYKPAVGDTVVMAKLGDSYVIMGNVLYKDLAPDTGNNYLELDDTDAFDLSAATGTSKFNDMTASTFTCKTTNMGQSGLVAQDLTVKYIHHSSLGKIGFFGNSQVGRQTITKLSSTADLSAVISKVNSVISILSTYGLVYVQ